MLVFTVAGPVDASDSELPSSIVISEGEDDKGSEACVGCKVAGGLSVQGVLPFSSGSTRHSNSGVNVCLLFR